MLCLCYFEGMLHASALQQGVQASCLLQSHALCWKLHFTCEYCALLLATSLAVPAAEPEPEPWPSRPPAPPTAPPSRDTEETVPRPDPDPPACSDPLAPCAVQEAAWFRHMCQHDFKPRQGARGVLDC